MRNANKEKSVYVEAKSRYLLQDVVSHGEDLRKLDGFQQIRRIIGTYFLWIHLFYSFLVWHKVPRFIHRASPCHRSGVCSRIPTPTWQQRPPPRPLPRPRCTDTRFWTRCAPASGTALTPSPWRCRTARCSPPPCPPCLPAQEAVVGPSWKRTGWFRPAPRSPWTPPRRWPATPLGYLPRHRRPARGRTLPTSCKASSAWWADWSPVRTGPGADPLNPPTPTAHLLLLWLLSGNLNRHDGDEDSCRFLIEKERKKKQQKLKAFSFWNALCLLHI